MDRAALPRLTYNVRVAEHHGGARQQEADGARYDDVVHGRLVGPVDRTDHLPVVVVIPVESDRHDRKRDALEPRVADRDVDRCRRHQLLVLERVDDGDVAIDADERQGKHRHDYEAVVCGACKVAPYYVDIIDVMDQGYQRRTHDDRGRRQIGDAQVHDEQVRDVITELRVLHDRVDHGHVADDRRHYDAR